MFVQDSWIFASFFFAFNKIANKNLANIQPSWPHAYSKTHFQPVITLHQQTILRQDSFRYLYFSDYKDYYTDTSVKFIISMTEDKLAEAEQSGLHKKFKLESTISTSNMVRFLGETRSFDIYSGWKRGEVDGLFLR